MLLHGSSAVKDSTKLKNKVDHDESSKCTKETNEEITDKNANALSAEELEPMLLGESKQS